MMTGIGARQVGVGSTDVNIVGIAITVWVDVRVVRGRKVDIVVGRVAQDRGVHHGCECKEGSVRTLGDR